MCSLLDNANFHVVKHTECTREWVEDRTQKLDEEWADCDNTQEALNRILVTQRKTLPFCTIF